MRYLLASFLAATSLVFSVEQITTVELCQLISSKTDLVIADARAKKFYTGYIIPGAVCLYHRMSDEQITTIVPSKDSLIVAYCSSLHCPVSHWLCERLIRMGYNRVLHYPAGIEGWIAAGNPVQEVKK